MPISTQMFPCNCSTTRISPILGAIVLLMTTNALAGFTIPPTHHKTQVSHRNINNNRILRVFTRPMPLSQQRPPQHFMSKDDSIDSADEGCEDLDDEDLEPVPVFAAADVRGRPAGVVLEDLGWRVEKLRLEEANKRRFLKSGPRFLPYGECKKWVQAWGERWMSAEEWNEWIASGEKRNSYIPSRPDEYFTRTGDWVSWEDFLGVEVNDDDANKD